MNVCIVEDQGYKNLYPLTKTRPVFGLRCGRFTIEERILRVLDPYIERVHYIMRPELEGVWKHRNCASTSIDFSIPARGNNLFINGRVLLDEKVLQEIIQNIQQKRPFVWKDGEQWIAIYHPEGSPCFTAEDLKTGTLDLSGIEAHSFRDQAFILYPWDLIRYNSNMICKDFLFIKKQLKRLMYPPLPENVVIFKRKSLIVGRYAEIHPFVTLDCSEGPIIIGDSVKIEAGSYIKGPASIGADCLISANTKLYNNTTLGTTCKVGGEISHSIIHGYSNKRHSGFLGNSYLGEWINIGAGSTNSNLKNNYNTVSVRINGEKVDTHTQFIGLFMGDHSRAAIGTRFNTATFVGVGCNVFGSGLTPHHIDDFSWGGMEYTEIYNFQKFINNAYRMMIRRERELAKAELELLYRLYKSSSVHSLQRDVIETGTKKKSSNGI